MVPALLLRLSAREARARAAEALADVGLADRLRHRPGELSGGEQQRVAIARALMNGPRVILADEPTGNLDPKTSEVIYDLFLRLQAERGIAFLVATHNPDLARRADRAYRLVDGRALDGLSGPAPGAERPQNRDVENREAKNAGGFWPGGV
jgi:lipoprotein-releasing system ATP-binding protein